MKKSAGYVHNTETAACILFLIFSNFASILLHEYFYLVPAGIVWAFVVFSSASKHKKSGGYASDGAFDPHRKIFRRIFAVIFAVSLAFIIVFFLPIKALYPMHRAYFFRPANTRADEFSKSCFPEKLPPSARDYSFDMLLPLLQGDGHFQIIFSADENYIREFTEFAENNKTASGTELFSVKRFGFPDDSQCYTFYIGQRHGIDCYYTACAIDRANNRILIKHEG